MSPRSIFKFLLFITLTCVPLSMIVAYQRDGGTRIYDEQGYHWNEPAAYEFWDDVATILDLTVVICVFGCIALVNMPGVLIISEKEEK